MFGLRSKEAVVVFERAVVMIVEEEDDARGKVDVTGILRLRALGMVVSR